MLNMYGKDHETDSKRRNSAREEGRCSSINFSTPHLAFLTFPSLTWKRMDFQAYTILVQYLGYFARSLLTAAHNALRAQVRSEGGVRIQRSASILAAAFIILLLGGEKYLKDGRLVLKLSSTPWLTLTPALTYPSYQWLTLNFFHSPRVSPIRLSTQAQCLLSPALSFENIR